MDEILRVLDALQNADQHKVALALDWKKEMLYLWLSQK